jgi:hypothetical protein
MTLNATITARLSAMLLMVLPSVASAAEPQPSRTATKPAKGAAANPKGAPAKPHAKSGTTQAQPAAGATATDATAPATAKPAAPSLRADAHLAQVLAAIDRALAAQPTAQQDLAGQMLVALARSSMVAVLHGHFALAGLGQAVRSGGMAAAEAAVMASTMAQNYSGLAEAYGELASQKTLQGELADLLRSMQILAQRAEVAAQALQSYTKAPNEAATLLALETALEDYRSRLQALFAHLGAKPAP